MSKGIGCQPFRDVLVVGGRATLVWAVREEPRHEDAQGALVKGRKRCSGSGHGLCLAPPGQSTDVVRMRMMMMDSAVVYD